MNSFENLKALAHAMGFSHIGIEFCEMLLQQPGSFSRLAVTHGLSVDVGIAAKREFAQFMEGMRAMFAPV